MRPRLLDLFSGAGGAARGYQRAGFHVTGVDDERQPRYAGDEFVQADALDFLTERGHEFDAVHASPPCQVHSALAPLAGPGHVDLIPETRELLVESGRPYVIENVEGATLDPTVILCGSMFGLESGTRVLRRHRLFEASFPIPQPPDECAGRLVGGVYGDGGGGPMTRGWKFHAAEAREAMGIDWMRRAELSQAIPPAFAEHVGRSLLTVVTARHMLS